jgi:hypothetical protein
MCLFHRQLDTKSRRIYAAGNLCLFSGIALTIFPGGFGHSHPALYNGLRFLLICSAIGLLRWSARRSGCCAAPPERNS